MKTEHEKVLQHILNHPSTDNGWSTYTVKVKPDTYTAKAHFFNGKLHNTSGAAVVINDTDKLYYLEGVEIDPDEFWNQGSYWDSRFGKVK